LGRCLHVVDMLLLVAEEWMRYPQCYEGLILETADCESALLSCHCHVNQVKLKTEEDGL